MSLSEAVQSTFKEHHTEIRRRSQVVQSSDDINSSTFERMDTDGGDDPFRCPEHNYVLYSLSQVEFAPRPTDPGNPALCVYGLFESVDEVKAHASKIQQAHPTHSILFNRTHEWIVAHSTVEHMSDEAYTTEHTRRLLSEHDALRDANSQEFAENVRLQRAGTVKDITEEEEETGKEQESDSLEKAQSHHKISHACRAEDQRFVVISFLKDDTRDKVPEFLFRVYACYETEVEANRYVRNVCGDHVREFDIDVIKTCSWAFPQLMEGVKSQKEVYRSSELNAVMAAHKKNPQEVDKFYRDQAMHESSKKQDTKEDECSKTPMPDQTDGVERLS